MFTASDRYAEEKLNINIAKRSSEIVTNLKHLGNTQIRNASINKLRSRINLHNA
jgi:hypothetical protein